VRRAVLAVLAAAVASTVVAYAYRLGTQRGSRAPTAFDEPAEPPLARGQPADWCTTGYEPIPGGCLAMPSPSPHASVLIYLHGRYAKDQSTEEADRQRRVAARFTSRGYAVLALRGTLGGCGAAELSSWYCWPSNERTAGSAGEVVEAWQGALRETLDRVHPERRFVLGFSNGGYFAVLLASRRLVRADAFVVAHGGPVGPLEAGQGTPPLLLLSADDDVAQEDMLRLDAELTRAHWPHDGYARTGPHGLTDQDIDAALSFIVRYEEPLPLDPPIAGLHRPSHHAHEASAPAAGEDDPPPDEPQSNE
jgi:dienelactone hydrolase